MTEHEIECKHKHRCSYCNGVDLDDFGYIFLSDIIEEDTAEMFVQELYKKALDRTNIVRPNLSSGLTVFLESPGGSVPSGMSIYSAIRHVSKKLHIPVTIVVNGLAASMATVILQAADPRIMANHAQLLLHNIKGFTFGESRPDDLINTAEAWKQSFNMVCRLYAERSTSDIPETKEPDWWKAKIEHTEWYLTAQESLKYGLVDEIE